MATRRHITRGRPFHLGFKKKEQYMKKTGILLGILVLSFSAKGQCENEQLPTHLVDDRNRQNNNDGYHHDQDDGHHDNDDKHRDDDGHHGDDNRDHHRNDDRHYNHDDDDHDDGSPWYRRW